MIHEHQVERRVRDQETLQTTHTLVNFRLDLLRFAAQLVELVRHDEHALDERFAQSFKLLGTLSLHCWILTWPLLPLEVKKFA